MSLARRFVYKSSHRSAQQQGPSILIIFSKHIFHKSSSSPASIDMRSFFKETPFDLNRALMKSQIINLPFGRKVFPKPILSALLFSSAAILVFIPFFFQDSFHPFSIKPSHPSPFPSSPSFSSLVKYDKRCDISRGEWINDPKAPYYSNRTCWTIQEHQNCIKYGRPDMEFLKWKWKPEGCDLPEFDPALFLELMRGKSLAFVGDSLARNHMQSLICLLSRVEYPKDVSITSDENFKHVLYAKHNFSARIFWSPFLIKAEEADPQHSSRVDYLWNLYLDEVDPSWASQIDHRFDYLVLSAGNWFSRPSLFFENRRLVGCSYCHVDNVTLLSPQFSNRRAFRTAFRAINRLEGFRGAVLLRTLSPSHFENGEWNKGGNCVRTRPFRSGETALEGLQLGLYTAQIEEFVAGREEGRKKGREYWLLDATEAMLLRPDGHPSRYGHWPHQNVSLYNDCVHWCLPGPIDVWNTFLLYYLYTNR